MPQVTDVFSFRVDETVQRLEDSLRTVEWAVAQLPESLYRATTLEPRALFEEGSWSAAMNLAHLTLYDERLGLPLVEALAAGGDGAGAVPAYGENWLINDAIPLSEEPRDHVLVRLRTARQRHVELAKGFTDERFNTPVLPGWRNRAGTPLKSPGWVLNKTFQHTWEHGNAILRITLFALR